MMMLKGWGLCLLLIGVTSGGKRPPYKYIGDDNFTMEDEKYCPEAIDSVIFDREVEWDIEDRANKTCPPEFMLTKSSIPGGGQGIFATVNIPAGVWLGPYDGERVYQYRKVRLDAEYAFKVKVNSHVYMYIDAWNPRTSNWIRYINAALDMVQQNVEFLQCYDKIYYHTIKPIPAGTEVLVFYGHGYVFANHKIDMYSYCKWYNGTFYQSIDSNFICDRIKTKRQLTCDIPL
ncbi:unnamed protein product [Owenia fusiformis]|uniref:SET domain-containing protein n=1 Tax=Owenia fusiformis TaxID=6347 RepID=A0A8S4N0T6_OWEFU|nr:unnamed protein product [Owenia fusiformis]